MPTADTVPDDPADPETAALELIVRLPVSLSERLATAARVADNIIGGPGQTSSTAGKAPKLALTSMDTMILKLAENFCGKAFPIRVTAPTREG